MGGDGEGKGGFDTWLFVLYGLGAWGLKNWIAWLVVGCVGMGGYGLFEGDGKAEREEGGGSHAWMGYLWGFLLLCR